MKVNLYLVSSRNFFFISSFQIVKTINSSSGDKVKVFRKPIIPTNGSQETKLYVHFFENYCEIITLR